MDMTKVPGIKMCRLAAPEGGELEGMVVSTASVPAGIPFMTVEAFATTYCQAEDKLLSGKDIVRQGQAADMHSFATKLMVDARPPALKASQLMSPMDFAVMQGKVYKVQEKLRAQEAEQRLQNEGTDGASVTGLAGVGIGVITSSSRLSAPMFAVPAEESPRKAKRKTPSSASTRCPSTPGAKPWLDSTADASGSRAPSEASATPQKRGLSRPAKSCKSDGSVVLSVSADVGVKKPEGAFESYDLEAIMNGYSPGRELRHAQR